MLDNTLFARGFDAASLRVTGEAIPIAEQVERNTCSSARRIYGFPDRRPGLPAPQRIAIGLVPSRRPEAEHRWRSGSLPESCALSDGTRVAVSQLDLKTGSWDIWLMEVATGRTSRFTLDGGVDDAPVWSSDGRRIAFKSDREGEVRFY